METLKLIYAWTLFTSLTLGFCTFCAAFYFRSNWRKYTLGRYVLYFMLTWAFIFVYSQAVAIFGPYKGKFYVDAIVLTGLSFGIWKLTFLLIKIQNEHPRRKVQLMRIFGREPTLIIAVIAAFLNFLVGFQLDFLSAEQAAWIMTVINAILGCVAAWMTKPIAPQAFTYAVSSLLGLLSAYGLDFSQEAGSSLQMLVLALMSFHTRGQVSPTDDAEFTGVLGDKTTTEN